MPLPSYSKPLLKFVELDQTPLALATTFDHDEMNMKIVDRNQKGR